MSAVVESARGVGPDRAAHAASDPRNDVVLVGRVAGAPEDRELPSGDVHTTWRVVVDRPPPRRRTPQGLRLPKSDTIWCVGWTARVRRAALGLSAGDVVEVSGALRQRYWRAGGALAGRTEVEVFALRRLTRGSA